MIRIDIERKDGGNSRVVSTIANVRRVNSVVRIDIDQSDVNHIEAMLLLGGSCHLFAMSQIYDHSGFNCILSSRQSDCELTISIPERGLL